MTRRLVLALGIACLLGPLGLVSSAQRAGTAAASSDVPSRLSDKDFWRLSTEWSEPNGFFRSDNLTSNELYFERVIGDLLLRTRQGDVYLGVGPEQNYTYMAALKPSMAVIFDVRRGNLHLQLMYKALFEMAADRAEFVSMLFAKPRPAGLGVHSSVVDIFSAFGNVATSEALYNQTLRAIDDRLTKVHALPLTAADLSGIAYVYRAFYVSGFAVRAFPTYADLMTATDAKGAFLGYLATEESFAVLKALETKNLVVPVVGDFGGPKAIRAVGAYLKAHGATVSAFYLSNVEEYLMQDGKWTAFCRNVASLPLDETSTFIRTTNQGRFGGGPGFVSSLGAMAAESKNCGQ